MAQATIGGIIASVMWLALFSVYRSVGEDIDLSTVIGSGVAFAMTASLVLVARSRDSSRTG